MIALHYDQQPQQLEKQHIVAKYLGETFVWALKESKQTASTAVKEVRQLWFDNPHLQIIGYNLDLASGGGEGGRYLTFLTHLADQLGAPPSVRGSQKKLETHIKDRVVGRNDMVLVVLNTDNFSYWERIQYALFKFGFPVKVVDEQ